MGAPRARRVSKTRLAALFFASCTIGFQGCAGSAPRDDVDRLACVFHPPLAEPVPSIVFDKLSNQELMEQARAGTSAAARVLAERYERGEGTPADPVQAAAWYRAAAVVVSEVRYVQVPSLGDEGSMVPIGGSNPPTPGDLLAMRRLADMYREGTAVPKNTARASELTACADNFDTLFAIQERQQAVRAMERLRAP